ncbi:MAG TPA: tetratricopeptide repeat protein [Pseudonocardiaceae bacterium]|nr:tetratricopeptide repeat protein [Pseudonocardiaceae bacterium]
MAEAALLDAYADLGIWLHRQIQTGDAAIAFKMIDWQWRTFGHLLGNALDSGLWDQAHALAAPLGGYWNARGLYEEARGWVNRARLSLETADGTPPPLDDPAGALWLFFTDYQAQSELNAHQLDTAERTYLEIRDMLHTQPQSLQQLQRLAVIYHHLGAVAQDQGHLDDAEEWHRQSLTIKQKLGNRPGMAATYHELGLIAQQRGRLDDAEEWHRQSLTISEELSDQHAMALSFVLLGLLTETQGRVDEALEWTVRCITLFDEFPHPMTGPGPMHLARLTAELGIETLERCWRRVTGQTLPPSVRDFVTAGPAEDVEGTRE